MEQAVCATPPRSAKPRVAVVVATCDRGPKISQLLQSIVASDLEDFEMVIVDQSDDSATRDAVTPYLSDARIQYVHSAQRGASRARNIGVRMTVAPYVAITDDDCIVPRGWLTGMIRPFAEGSNVGVVFCSVIAVESDRGGLTPQIMFETDRRITNLREVWTSRKGLSLGAGMAIRRTTFEGVGGFDESLGPGAKFGACEDNDLSWRALLAGWNVYQSSQIQVLHDGFRPMHEVRSLLFRDYHGVGGAIAKYIRAREPWSLWFVARWVVSSAFVDPLRDLAALRRPRGMGRALVFLRGVAAGLRMRCQVGTLIYQSSVCDAPQNERADVTPLGY